MKTYKIGARGSLLSLSQTKQSLDFIQQNLPGFQSEIVAITTRGDQTLDRPLNQLSGDSFFTKELEEALLRKEVDIICHSYKDLAMMRPEGIRTLLIPKRSFPHDVLLIRKDKKKQLKDTTHFVLGSSSPRRQWQAQNALLSLLPLNQKKPCRLELKSLRGNVPTRLKKLIDGEFDGILLALAGLERLVQDVQGKEQIQSYLKELDFMLLPLSKFPTAASQGALILECLEESFEQDPLLQKIWQLSDQVTCQTVAKEREIFKSHGGGCHLPLGVNVYPCFKGQLYSVQGQDQEGQTVSELFYLSNKKEEQQKLKAQTFFIGLPKFSSKEQTIQVLTDQLIEKRPEQLKISELAKIKSFDDIYLTSAYTFESFKQLGLHQGAIWISGFKTWEKLIKRFQENPPWVHGCSDSLGDQELETLRNSKALKSMHSLDAQLWVFTHSSQDSSLQCYTRETLKVDDAWVGALRKCKHFFWTSLHQFEIYAQKFPFILDSDCQHASGLGKTSEKLQAKYTQINFKSYFSAQDFLNDYR